MQAHFVQVVGGVTRARGLLRTVVFSWGLSGHREFVGRCKWRGRGVWQGDVWGDGDTTMVNGALVGSPKAGSGFL